MYIKRKQIKKWLSYEHQGHEKYPFILRGLFCPVAFFFLISGSWQTFDLHEASKSGDYKPPAIIKSLSQVHKNQRWVDSKKIPQAISAFSVFGSFDVIGIIGYHYIRHYHGF